MTVDSDLDRLLNDIERAVASRKRPMQPVTVLIDGPSGAGKTLAASVLAERTGWRVVHLDEFYPGWYGLQEGSRMVHEQVLRGMNPGYWRWNWEAGAPGDWASLDVRDSLVVEGVGAVTEDNIEAAKERGAVITVKIDGPRDERRARAIERDPDYDEWFETWEEQEKEYFDTLAVEAEFEWNWEEDPAT
ncbi:hypothetical protein VVR26_04855 [Corynebacterium camporealensis]|uniref:hypothetical protein n=1 Tax=Corynebacterium camporealensis TaxID=161896 RepID=UPI0034CF4544